MEKLAVMQKQLLFLHEELRKVKGFHKESAKNFKNFYQSMSNSFKILNKGNIFNDIQYSNILNLNVIEFFNNQILRQSQTHTFVHRRLKEEGNKLKLYEKELEKRMKTFQSEFKKRENQILACETFELSEMKAKEVQIIDLNREVDVTLKELSFQFTLIRENIQRSFDDYIESLCLFAETKTQLKLLHGRTGQNFKDCSPLFERKFDLLMNINNTGNFGKSQEETQINSKITQDDFSDKKIKRNIPRSDYSATMTNISRFQNQSHLPFEENDISNPNNLYEVEYLNQVVDDQNIQDRSNFSKSEFRNPGTFYTPNKSRMNQSSSNSNFKENQELSYIKTNSSAHHNRNYSEIYEDDHKIRYNNEIRDNRNKMMNSYLSGRSRSSRNEQQEVEY